MEKTRNEIENGLIKESYGKHHTARSRGYVSRIGDTCMVEEYKGRFGEGFKIYTAAWDSTQYCWVTYWVK